jgi:hypothetical protein
MNSPCTIQELNAPNFYQRLFHTLPKENAIIELNNLIASKAINEISEEQISSIAEKYKINFRKKFLEQLIDIYRSALIQCLSDNLIDLHDAAYLNRLRSLLSLTESDVEESHNIETAKIYEYYYQLAISDGKIDDQESEILDKLSESIKLSTTMQEEISNRCRSQFMKEEFSKITVDKKISPDEWSHLELIAKNLNVTINSDESVDKLKLYWQIENGELPIKEVEINLQKGEKCYYSSYAEWYENRSITKRINYSGPTTRIKIIKGVYYRAGSVNVQRVTHEELQKIDYGKVFLTNKRLIFLGNKKNTNIQLSKILSLNPYSDGVGIEKDSGKSPIIKVDDNADILTMTISRLINDSKQ